MTKPNNAAATSVQSVVLPPDCVLRLAEAGWVFHYDSSTKYIGADHPLGGRQSILRIDCPSRSGFEGDEIGQRIVDWFRSAEVCRNAGTVTASKDVATLQRDQLTQLKEKPNDYQTTRVQMQ